MVAANTKRSKVVIIVTLSIARGMNLTKVLLNQQKQKKRKFAEKSAEDAMLDQTMSVLAKSKKETDANDNFGQSIALTLKSILDKRTKLFIKYKIHKLLCQSQFGN